MGVYEDVVESLRRWRPTPNNRKSGGEEREEYVKKYTNGMSSNNMLIEILSNFLSRNFFYLLSLD